MKKTIILMAAAVAAMLLSLSSCQKTEMPTVSEEETNGTTEESTDEITIIGEFDGNFKTTLGSDTKTPQWAVGDQIKIIGTSGSGTSKSLTAAMINNNKITFTVTNAQASGTIYAIYPASVTSMTKCTDGKIKLTIPSEQDGTFASANICVAKGTKDKNNSVHLIFRNATSVLEFSEEDVKASLIADITAENALAGEITASFNGNELSLDATGLTQTKVTMESYEKTGKYYVAVAPVKTGIMDFAYCKDLIYLANHKIKSITLKRNNIYNCPAPEYENPIGTINGHNYVKINGVKWATNNLAASTYGEQKWLGDKSKNTEAVNVPLTPAGKGSESGEKVVNGDYFQWAAYKNYAYVEGQTIEDMGLLVYESFTNPYIVGGGTAKWTRKTNKSFAAASAPYYKSGYTKYKTGGDILEKNDDAASILWENTWRMPTTEEFKNLYATTYWAWDDTDKGKYVFVPTASHLANTSGSSIPADLDKANAILFFPAPGYLYSTTTYYYEGERGYYWSSSLESGNNAYYLYFRDNTTVTPGADTYRYHGHTIRPVAD